MSKVDIMSFLKFGSETNILDLYENGTIYCHTIEHFRKLEDEYLRGDSYEGTYKITNYPPDSKIQLTFQDGNTLNLKSGNLHLRESYSDINGNIYCITAITEQDVIQAGTLKLDSKLEKFGTHFLLIKDMKKFYPLLIDTFQKNNLKIKTGFVKYYDRKKFNGELDLFHKPDEYVYQKEFRVLVYNDEIKPLKIQLGSLRGISEVMKTTDLKTLEYKYNGLY